MNKSDLIRKTSEYAEVPMTVVKPVVDSMWLALADILETGESVMITGFGTFSNIHREAREARNPSNGEAVAVPAHGVPHFKAAPALKDKCW